jgi:hypothetical protein
MPPRVRANRPIERAGVNAARALFEAANYLFHEVPIENDFGKDAYVDLVEARQVTGVCVAIQIKSGDKYRRADGYAIPVEDHEEVWRQSTLPIAGIVHDTDTSLLYWGSITCFLDKHPTDLPAAVPISANRS